MITFCSVNLKCGHAFRTGRHKRQADITLLLEYIFLRITVLPAKSDSDVMFCLQSYEGLMIDRSLVY